MRPAHLTGLAVAALLLGGPTAGSAQVTASLAAVTAFHGRSLAVERKPGCWGCGITSMGEICTGGHIPGFWNCTVTWVDSCVPSSPGCGEGALLPLDADGATQYVSRGAVLELAASLTQGAPEYRNCEGAIVARVQPAAQIAAVRHRTATLTL